MPQMQSVPTALQYANISFDETGDVFKYLLQEATDTESTGAERMGAGLGERWESTESL